MKKEKRYYYMSGLAVAAALTIGTLVQPVAVSAKTGKIKSIQVTNVSRKTVTLSIGETFSLKAKVKVTGKISKKVKFKSGNTGVATVSKKGLIKAKKAGVAKITVSSAAKPRKKTAINVIVKDTVKIKKITLNKTNLTLKVDEEDGDEDTYVLIAAVSPSNATDKEIIWTSSDTDVVEVDEDGYIMAMDVGEAVVTAKTKDGSVYASCYVKVVERYDFEDEDDSYDEDDEDEDDFGQDNEVDWDDDDDYE